MTTTTTTATGYVILDEDGKAIAFCDGDIEAAEILRECVFGDSVIPSEDYEEGEDEQ